MKKFINQRHLLFFIILSLINYQVLAKPTPDFLMISNPTQREQTFFKFMLPKIQQANQQIYKQRQYLLKLYRQRNKLTPSQLKWLSSLAKYYQVNFTVNNQQSWQTLIKRVDIIPVSIALAQADKETAAGTTRFAWLGHNYYGTWCFQSGCGIIPRQRKSGARFEVKRYTTAAASIKDYMHNLNTNPAYQNFRNLRAQQRQLKLPLNGPLLLSGLLAYSSLHVTYLNDVKAIIYQNDLTRYDQ